MEKLSNSQINLLEELSKLHTVLVVSDKLNVFPVQIFVVLDYRPPTTDNLFLSISNFKRITDVVDENSTYTNTQNILKSITTKIEFMESTVQERKFDKNQFTWVKI